MVLTLVIAPLTLQARGKTCKDILNELAIKHAGQFEAVVAKFQKEALEGRNPARAFYILGIAHDIKGLKAEARNYYKRSIQLKPNGNPATKLLNYMDGDKEACSVADEKSAAMVDASVISGVSPKEMEDNYSRYKGKTVGLEGWILDKLSRKRGKYEIVCSVLPGGSSGSAGRMDGYFLIRTSSKIPSDPRIARGAKISVRGIVKDRDFMKSPVIKEISENRKIIIDPLGVRIMNNGVQSNPLTLRLK